VAEQFRVIATARERLAPRVQVVAVSQSKLPVTDGGAIEIALPVMADASEAGRRVIALGVHLRPHSGIRGTPVGARPFHRAHAEALLVFLEGWMLACFEPQAIFLPSHAFQQR